MAKPIPELAPVIRIFFKAQSSFHFESARHRGGSINHNKSQKFRCQGSCQPAASASLCIDRLDFSNAVAAESTMTYCKTRQIPVHYNIVLLWILVTVPSAVTGRISNQPASSKNHKRRSNLTKTAWAAEKASRGIANSPAKASPSYWA